MIKNFFVFALITVLCSCIVLGENGNENPELYESQELFSEILIQQTNQHINMGRITNGIKIVQSFKTDEDNTLSGLDIYFSTFMRANTNNVILTISKKIQSNEFLSLFSTNLEASILKDNHYYRFSLPFLQLNANEEYFISLESTSANYDNSITIWVATNNPYPDGKLYIITGSNTNIYESWDIKFRVLFVAKGTHIEYYTYLYLTKDWWDRKVYRSKYTDIAITFGDSGIMEGYFYEHFFQYNLDFDDYFCIPDDLIISYNSNTLLNGTSSWVKAYSLYYETEHGYLDENKKHIIVKHKYINGKGFNPLAKVEHKGNGILPEADIEIWHEMYYDKNYVPMYISIRNKSKSKKRFIYVFQDRAWMTDSEIFSMPNVRQYWPDGEYYSTRVWYINEKNRNTKSNWIANYNDRKEKMCAVTYAPPESVGIILHATWNNLNLSIKSLDPFGYATKISNWFILENILTNVNALLSSPYDNTNWKWHGTVIDFGYIEPEQTITQAIVKIMFSKYYNRNDMVNKIWQIINEIPTLNVSKIISTNE